MICAACGLLRDPDDLIAFWPIGDPGQRRFACRVTRPSPVAQESCFRAVVASRLIHEIGPAYAVGGHLGPLPPGLIVGESGPEEIVPVPA